MENSKTTILLFILFSLFLPSCSFWAGEVESDLPLLNNKAKVCAQTACIMTVFVHGTVIPYPSLKAFCIVANGLFSKKEKQQSVYQKYLDQVKKEGVYKRQPINERGLRVVDLQEKIDKSSIYYIAQQTALLYQESYDFAYSDHADDVKFYTFGWSGRLDKKCRRDAARDLYKEIIEERDRLAKETFLPIKIHLLAHSHGGNVTLNLEKIEQEEKKGLVLDRVMFFGCPVQSETEPFITSSVFKSVYHFYSDGDHVQVSDVVSTKDFFSRRMFGQSKKNNISIPDNLYQIEVQVGRYKPFHWELWLWANKTFPYFFYRKKFPLYPVPLSVFSPLLVNLIDSKKFSLQNDRKILLQIDKNEESFTMHANGEKYSCSAPIKRLKRLGIEAL